MHTIKTVSVASLAIYLLLITQPATAEPLRTGAAICNAAVYQRGGNEQHDTSLYVRNYNDTGTVTITRIQAWNNDGVLTYDSDVDGLPPDAFFKQDVGPHQSSRTTASELQASGALTRGSQVRFDYDYTPGGMDPSLGFVRYSFTSGSVHTARHSGSCTAIPPGNRNGHRNHVED
jgi:hypothetical protein